ncbi:MAG: histidine kinase, partial [Rudanella sp.]|nr:histidine kinase [Rudanella sp.]
MALVLAGLGYGGVRLYLKNRLHKQRQRYQLSLDARHTERRRLSRDLHDNIGMDLVLLKMRINTVLVNRQSLSTEEINRLQDYSDRLGRLCADVRAIYARFGAGTGPGNGTGVVGGAGAGRAQPTLEINFTHDRVGVVSASLEQPMLWVAKELLNNTIRHAGASLVDVELERQNGIPTVADNGRGYDPAQLPDTAGIGLQNIQTTVMDLD